MNACDYGIRSDHFVVLSRMLLVTRRPKVRQTYNEGRKQHYEVQLVPQVGTRSLCSQQLD